MFGPGGNKNVFGGTSSGNKNQFGATSGFGKPESETMQQQGLFGKPSTHNVGETATPSFTPVFGVPGQSSMTGSSGNRGVTTAFGGGGGTTSGTLFGGQAKPEGSVFGGAATKPENLVFGSAAPVFGELRQSRSFGGTQAFGNKNQLFGSQALGAEAKQETFGQFGETKHKQSSSLGGQTFGGLAKRPASANLSMLSGKAVDPSSSAVQNPFQSSSKRASIKQAVTQQAKEPSNLFGKPAASNLFGKAEERPQQLFGKGTDSTAGTHTTKTLFGKPASQEPQTEPHFGKPMQPKSLFGKSESTNRSEQQPTFGHLAESQRQKEPSTLFGKPAEAGPSKALFGKVDSKPKPPGLFGKPVKQEEDDEDIGMFFFFVSVLLS